MTPAPRAVFQNSRLHILFAIVLAVCAVPVAFGLPFLWPIMLVPVGVVVWVLRVRTTVDAEAVTVRRIVGGRRVPWSEISTLHLTGPNGSQRRVSAVLSDGTELPLPAVGVRDLPQLAAVSGGRLPDPAGDEA